MKDKNKLKKIAIIGGVIISLFLIWDFTPILKVPIANKMFGCNQCSLEVKKNNGELKYSEYGTPIILDFNDKHSGLAGCAVTTWKCNLCWRIKTHPDTAVPMLCDVCSFFTNRCTQCADLLDI